MQIDDIIDEYDDLEAYVRGALDPLEETVWRRELGEDCDFRYDELVAGVVASIRHELRDDPLPSEDDAEWGDDLEQYGPNRSDEYAHWKPLHHTYPTDSHSRHHFSLRFLPPNNAQNGDFQPYALAYAGFIDFIPWGSGINTDRDAEPGTFLYNIRMQEKRIVEDNATEYLDPYPDIVPGAGQDIGVASFDEPEELLGSFVIPFDYDPELIQELADAMVKIPEELEQYFYVRLPEAVPDYRAKSKASLDQEAGRER